MFDLFIWWSVGEQEDINKRLDTFFLSRIGLRMLIGQHAESLDKFVCLRCRIESILLIPVFVDCFYLFLRSFFFAEWAAVWSS